MKVVGYADRFSVAPGQTIRFMVSCATPEYCTQIVRLLHGDADPSGPGLKEVPVEPEPRRIPGRIQRIATGSHVAVPDHSALNPETGLSIQAWICPTLPGSNSQAVFSRLTKDGGFVLGLSEAGEIEFRIFGTSGSFELNSGAPMRRGAWYFIALTWDFAASILRLQQVPVEEWPLDPTRRLKETTLPRGVNLAAISAPLLMAAQMSARANSPVNHFNGKIDRPRIFGEALSERDLESLRNGTDPGRLGKSLIGSWDFSREPETSRAIDVGPLGLHGHVANTPARGVTGYNWTGLSSDFKERPEHYGAIHFHDDDLEDANWDVDFDFEVPDLPSGVYAAKLTTEDAFDYIPFFVKPPEGTATADILFLAPTMSYMAYGNEHLVSRDDRRNAALQMSLDELLALGSPYEKSALRYILENNLHSLYDFHSDGSGVAYSSRLRPILTFRPLYNKPLFHFKAPHQFNEDLYLIDWLNEKNIKCDVATDEDLHLDGSELLNRYRVIITGSHPEYWTEPMYSALEAYLNGGGRIMYLGGNGFYWVTSMDPNRPHIIEVRRQAGMRTWEAQPGELHHSTTGELGGLWRHRGKAPQRILGIGTIAAGSEPARPYRRQPGSHDPRAAFIFEGIGETELLGDFGLHLGGAAGWELDRIDEALGTPPHTLLLASSFGHSDDYQLAVEELWESNGRVGGKDRPDIRADMVFFEYPKGGAVFSVGSISYLGSLSHNSYDNNISRITENVLRAFSSATLPTS